MEGNVQIWTEMTKHSRHLFLLPHHAYIQSRHTKLCKQNVFCSALILTQMFTQNSTLCAILSLGILLWNSFTEVSLRSTCTAHCFVLFFCSFGLSMTSATCVIQINCFISTLIKFTPPSGNSKSFSSASSSTAAATSYHYTRILLAEPNDVITITLGV